MKKIICMINDYSPPHIFKKILLSKLLELSYFPVIHYKSFF